MATHKKSRRKKKLHWTQTPEGKKKMSVAQKKRWRNKRNEEVQELTKEMINNNQFQLVNENGTIPEKATPTIGIAEDIEYENKITQQYHEAIAYTHVTTWLNLYAEVQGISESSLTRELAEALLRKISG